MLEASKHLVVADGTGIGSKETEVENPETDDVRYETSESTIIAQA